MKFRAWKYWWDCFKDMEPPTTFLKGIYKSLDGLAWNLFWFVFFPALVLIRAAYWGWLAARNKFKFSRLDNEEKAKLSNRKFWKDFVINK